MKRAHPGKQIMNALTDFLQQLHFETLTNRKILPSPPTLGYGSEKKFPMKKIKIFIFSKFVYKKICKSIQAVLWRISALHSDDSIPEFKNIGFRNR